MEQKGDLKVSVVIPCYNQGRWLWEAIESVLAQDMGDFEIIVINDGSTDPGTNKIVEEIDHPKITTVTTVNQGLSTARNEAIARARGKYILPLDADDRIHPSYLGKASKLLDENPQLGIIYCRAEFFGEEQGVWDLEPYRFPDILISPQIFASSMYRRSDWEAVGGYSTDMIHGWEDYDFWLSLIEKGVGVHRIDEVLFAYRKTAGGMAGLDRNQMLYSFKKLYQHHRELYESNIGVLFDAVIASKPLRDRASRPDREVFEIFIPDAHGYANRNIREQNYLTGVWSRISIFLNEIPESGIHHLRLDPAQQPGLIDIASIRLLHAGTGEILYEASAAHDYHGMTTGHGTFALPHDRFLRLFCSHNDGHFFLPRINRSLLEQPIQLEIWIRKHPDFSEMEEFCTQKIEKIGSIVRLEEIQENLKAHERQAAELKNEIGNLQEHSRQLAVRAGNAQQEAAKHSEEAQRLDQQLRAVDSEKADLEKRCQQLEKDVTAAREALDNANTLAESLRKELEASRKKEGLIPTRWFGR